MKAKIIDNEIVRYSSIPKNYKNIIGFDKLPEEAHRKEGFFNIVFPEIDIDIQERGNIFFDNIKKVFTYSVLEKVLDFAEIKERKLYEVTSELETDITPKFLFEFLHKIATNQPMEDETKTKIIELAERRDMKISEIDKITDTTELAKLNIKEITETTNKRTSS